MKWVLLILSLAGDPKIAATYDDRATCEKVAQQWHERRADETRCLPLPSREEKR